MSPIYLVQNTEIDEGGGVTYPGWYFDNPFSGTTEGPFKTHDEAELALKLCYVYT